MTVPTLRLADLDTSWRAVAERVTTGHDVDRWRWFLSSEDQDALVRGREDDNYATAQQREPESGRVMLLARQLPAVPRRAR